MGWEFPHRVSNGIADERPDAAMACRSRRPRTRLCATPQPDAEASRAFNQWGTPYYYVVDADGRVHFDVSTDADDVLARAEALELASERPGPFP